MDHDRTDTAFSVTLPLRTRLWQRLGRLLRVGQGPGESRSPAEINRDAQAQMQSQLKGWT